MADAAKQAAGQAAATLVEDGMLLGLGSGSTVGHFLEALAERDLDIAGVPASEATAARCRDLGIALLAPHEVDTLQLCVDGADELDGDLSLTKGGGGALLREKVVAGMSERFVVIATHDKVVERLGDTYPLPVEVVPFALGPVRRRLLELGYEVVERADGDHSYRTDNGNAILDCRVPGGIADPMAMEISLALIPGVADSGLFVDLATSALLGHPDGSVSELARQT